MDSWQTNTQTHIPCSMKPTVWHAPQLTFKMYYYTHRCESKANRKHDLNVEYSWVISFQDISYQSRKVFLYSSFIKQHLSEFKYQIICVRAANKVYCLQWNYFLVLHEVELHWKPEEYIWSSPKATLSFLVRSLVQNIDIGGLRKTEWLNPGSVSSGNPWTVFICRRQAQSLQYIYLC